MTDLRRQLAEFMHDITFGKVVSAIFLAIFAPVQEILITVILLGAVDFMLGIYASYKEGFSITSRSMRRSVHKMVVYCLSIILCYHIQDKLLDYPLTVGITGLIGIIEGKSIFENLYRITKIDFLKIIIGKLNAAREILDPPSSSKDLVAPYQGKKSNEKTKQKEE